MKVIQNYKLFFVRFTPLPEVVDRWTPGHPLCQIEGRSLDGLEKKYFDKINEPYTFNKGHHPHQAFGVMEVSKAGVLHFHYLLCVKGSITTVRKQLKERLDAHGNKMMSMKEYPYSESSFDKSLVYMYKGNEKTRVLSYEYGLKRIDTEFKDKGAVYYANSWVQQEDKRSASQKARDEKYSHYRKMVLEMLDKERRDTFLSKYLFKIGLEELKVKIFKRLTYEKLRMQNFGNFRAISEMTQWLALDIYEEVENIDSLLDPIYEKYAENYKIKII